jgi:hypothetical protein
MDEAEPDEPVIPKASEVTPEQLAAVISQWLVEKPAGGTKPPDDSPLRPER